MTIAVDSFTQDTETFRLPSPLLYGEIAEELIQEDFSARQSYVIIPTGYQPLTTVHQPLTMIRQLLTTDH